MADTTNWYGNHKFLADADFSGGTIQLPNDPVAVTATPADSSVTAAKLADAVADKLAVLSVTAAAAVGDKRILTITAKDAQGNALAEAVTFDVVRMSAADASYAVSDDGKGSVVYDDTTTDRTTCKTHTDGIAEIGITTTAAETLIIGIGQGAASEHWVRGTTISVAFA